MANDGAGVLHGHPLSTYLVLVQNCCSSVKKKKLLTLVEHSPDGYPGLFDRSTDPTSWEWGTNGSSLCGVVEGVPFKPNSCAAHCPQAVRR